MTSPDITRRVTNPAHRAHLVGYVAHKMGIDPALLVGDMPFDVIATVRGDKLLGAMLYTNYRVASIEMTAAGEPGWFTRANLRTYFGFPFVQLGCRRVTAIAHRRNKASRALAERLGLKLEGVARDGYPDGDAMIYGLVKRECRWI